MTRTQMAAEMLRRGVPLPSEDTARYSGTILWRQSNRFVNVPGKGYYLIDLMSDAELKTIVGTSRALRARTVTWAKSA